MSHYIVYYNQQSGGGGGIGVKNVYAGSNYQRGSGIGSFIGAIFRKIVAYLSSGAKAVGKEAVRTALNVLNDIANDGVSFKDSVKTRLREFGKNLKRKAEKKVSEMMMKGHGYKSMVVRRKRQSTSSRVRTRNAPRRKTVKRLKKSKTDKKRNVKRRKNKKTVRSVRYF